MDSVTDLPWDDVRTFLAIAEEGSLSRAAKRLRVGQPTVSRRLAALEQQLGYPLFKRKAEGAILTRAGQRLLDPARRMADWALAEMVPGVQPVFASDDFLVQWRACEAGVGAMLRGYRFSYPSPVINLDIDLGRYATSTLHIVCARSALAIPRIRAVADLMLAAFQAEPRA